MAVKDPLLGQHSTLRGPRQSLGGAGHQSHSGYEVLHLLVGAQGRAYSPVRKSPRAVPRKICIMSWGNPMKLIRHSFPFPPQGRGGESILDVKMLQEGLWGIYLTGSRAWLPFR